MPQIQEDLLQHLQARQTEEAAATAQKKSRSWVGKLGGLGILLAILWKTKAFLLLGKLKFIFAGAKFLSLGKLFTTGGSMMLSVALYATMWGWPYAVGFVILLLVHEMGHVLALRFHGISASVPIFIPFMGAFIALKEMPKNVKVEAEVALAGPLVGSLGAFLCYAAYLFTGKSLFLSLAYAGFFINLFNLMPVLPLDGGRVVAAISPKLWIAGLAIAVTLLIARPSLILILLLALSLPRLIAAFKQSPEEADYYQVAPGARTALSLGYFGLAAILGVMMVESHQLLDAIIKARTF